MKAIYSSKLYMTSSRKQEIMAAIKNPVNTELVQQLRTYLDKEYIKPEYLERDYKEKEKAKEEPQVLFDENPSASPAPIPTGGSGGPPSGENFSDEELNELDQQIEDEAEAAEGLGDEEVNPDAESNIPEDENNIEESVQIKAAEEICPAPSIDIETIKGSLNSREDCAGVARVSIKNCNELWIYYNDSINLNNVMEPVIAFLENAGYTNLAFNRLARTDNAIVFEITISV